MDSGWITPDMWSNPYIQGLLAKKGHGFSSGKWNDRYFRLQGHRLFYFKTSLTEKLHGNIPLNGAVLTTEGLLQLLFPMLMLLIICFY
eukprot:TRINITY_DN1304_c0_g2_i1.p1 TRINITY_DN1304_c0_g2~~TRINITY_DN1304_c0_g2_i1.p1  ORF type:complete len:101 (-),score=5.48 TRINITY_DN1304_c0_g2_i1:93-356(-)